MPAQGNGQSGLVAALVLLLPDPCMSNDSQTKHSLFQDCSHRAPAERTGYLLLQSTTCWRGDSHRLKVEYMLPWIAGRGLLCRSWLPIFNHVCRTV